MKLSRFLPALVLISFVIQGLQAAPEEYRTFTNAKGQQIRAKLVGLENDQATIKMENGQTHTLALTVFSEEDQTFIRRAGAALQSGFVTKASASDQIPVEKINEAVGAPLFGESVLWQADVTEVASRLDLKRESQTKTQCSYRSYPDAEARLFGARPFTVALYGESDHPTRISIVFANKGDSFGAAGSAEKHFDREAPKDVEEALKYLNEDMASDVKTITEKLSALLGEPVKQRFGEGKGRRTVHRWDWRGHALLLTEKEDEYVGVEIATQAFADQGGRSERVNDAVIRAAAANNIEKRPNGDVVLQEIPMVDQGPKGYCAPATAERAMRYLGVSADMYLLAMAGETQLGGGTSVDRMLDAVETEIRNKGRSFDKWRSEFKLRDIKKHIDRGVPVIWALFSSDEWNATANERTKERKTVTDWDAWRKKTEEIRAKASLAKDHDSAHVVLVIGYNESTGEIAFSDSWGERYTERWMTLEEAQCVSQDAFWVVGF